MDRNAETGPPPIDVRAILDGDVWPLDPHDFVGDTNDILDEQVALLDDAGREAVAYAVLGLLADPDHVIRARVVIALSWVRHVADGDDITLAVRRAAAGLDMPGPPGVWKISQPTLWAEALSRLR